MAAGKSLDRVAVIMAGGSGTRFWPASRPELPKQFLKLTGPKSLIAETADRVSKVVPRDAIYVCAGETQKSLLKGELPQAPLILEPAGRNTAACLMLSVAHLLRAGAPLGTPMIALPADHYIQDTEAFAATLQQAMAFAADTHGLLTLGIVPTSPHTGYGYIEAGDPARGEVALQVRRFVEKPDRARAEEFLRKKNFFWNSGIFIWTLGAIRSAFEAHLSEPWSRLLDASSAADIKKIYDGLPSLPIDTAVMEKADNLYVIPAKFDWSDIGSWDALHKLRAKSPEENVTVSGDARAIESTGCLIDVPTGKKIALVGVKDLVVVESEGTLLICARDKDQLVREASKAFESPR